MRACFALSAVSVFSASACLIGMSVALSSAALAAPPITITSQAALDGPIRYSVKVTSAQFGNTQETRSIRSGQSDDYTWKTVPPGGAVPVSSQCPGYESMALDANGAMLRQVQLRVAPVVSADGTATIQLSFLAQTPRGTKVVTKSAKKLKCADSVKLSQIVRFSMPTDGSSKTLTLNDGTQITLTARR
ncbi:DUF6013 family protein [Paraburkholderia bonniea]|uniref:DUF6013 family protein n=1 Tax=Paraburkholderia bonniea TaxID=2152891 RepID=UPI001290EC4C|nr:DUF6013 family protein [Paraburkholderia bonniea]WJF89013.1 DUF6013 family protein [Paraburkholderia bonniea]WJF92329.1 DUF6013 family protein [Paraburkholderia bonniea]